MYRYKQKAYDKNVQLKMFKLVYNVHILIQTPKKEECFYGSTENSCTVLRHNFVQFIIDHSGY